MIIEITGSIDTRGKTENKAMDLLAEFLVKNDMNLAITSKAIKPHYKHNTNLVIAYIEN